MKQLIIALLLFFTLNLKAQQTISLQNCYELVAKNYPLAKQSELLQTKINLDKAAIEKEKLPKISVNAQATYQSEVMQLPFSLPNATIKPLNNDQYKATFDVNQLLYNGGLINEQRNLKELQLQTQQQQNNVTVYQLKNKVNGYYFSILLLQEKTKILQTKKDFLTEKIKEVNAAVKHGAILPASAQIIEVELIKIEQQLIDIQFEKNKFIENLASITNQKIANNSQFITPEFKEIENIATRPELQLFDYQTQQLETLKKISSKTNVPKIAAFAQAGYGNPGLNMLENSFQTFYITGLKLNWNIFDWNKTKKEQQSLDISKQLIATEKETFELNQTMQLQEFTTEIEKLKQLISTDDSIIQLREKIQQATDAQMRNGVITTSEYLNEVTQLFESKINKKTREIQLSLAQATYQIINGK